MHVQKAVTVEEFIGPYVPPQNLTKDALKGAGKGEQGAFANTISNAVIKGNAAAGGLQRLRGTRHYLGGAQLQLLWCEPRTAWHQASISVTSAAAAPYARLAHAAHCGSWCWTTAACKALRSTAWHAVLC